MRAEICQNETLRVETLDEPILSKDQVLLKVLRCGICGSDLHLRHHCDHGPRTTRKLKPGTRVCAVPLLRRDDRIDMIGLSATSPGAATSASLKSRW